MQLKMHFIFKAKKYESVNLLLRFIFFRASAHLPTLLLTLCVNACLKGLGLVCCYLVTTVNEL